MAEKNVEQLMEDQQSRELLLKRILPAVVMITFYFVFISHSVVQKVDQREQDVFALKSKGINEYVLQNASERLNEVKTELDVLKKKDQVLMNELKGHAGFLFGSTNGNEQVLEITRIMNRTNLSIAEDHGLGDLKASTLSQTYADINKWLVNIVHVTENARVHRFVFSGFYIDVYRMLAAFSEPNINAAPVSLSMEDMQDDTPGSKGKKNWTLDVWI